MEHEQKTEQAPVHQSLYRRIASLAIGQTLSQPNPTKNAHYYAHRVAALKGMRVTTARVAGTMFVQRLA